MRKIFLLIISLHLGRSAYFKIHSGKDEKSGGISASKLCTTACLLQCLKTPGCKYAALVDGCANSQQKYITQSPVYELMEETKQLWQGDETTASPAQAVSQNPTTESTTSSTKNTTATILETSTLKTTLSTKATTTKPKTTTLSKTTVTTTEATTATLQATAQATITMIIFSPTTTTTTTTPTAVTTTTTLQTTEASGSIGHGAACLSSVRVIKERATSCRGQVEPPVDTQVEITNWIMLLTFDYGFATMDVIEFDAGREIQLSTTMHVASDGKTRVRIQGVSTILPPQTTLNVEYDGAPLDGNFIPKILGVRLLDANDRDMITC